MVFHLRAHVLRGTRTDSNDSELVFAYALA
jgi:hypothetical protein